jgi:formamidopyrimidine-DNA glycosylase
MPELPDVEIMRMYVESTSLGKPVSGVSVPDGRILDGVTPQALGRGLHGHAFTGAGRRGKYLLVTTDTAKTLLVHFGMTGDIAARGSREPPEYTVAEFRFADGSYLFYASKRILGKIALYPTTDQNRIPDVARLGPEPLTRSFTFRKFTGAIGGRTAAIHTVLMNQELIAGIGNIYSDEITFQARIRPDRPAGDISGKESKNLYDKMKWVLKKAIERDADTDRLPRTFIIPHREKGGRCPACGGEVEKKTISGRSSYFCPSCQK